MGIEPTNRMFDIRLNGFEDRAGHQPWFHFLLRMSDAQIGRMWKLVEFES